MSIQQNIYAIALLFNCVTGWAQTAKGVNVSGTTHIVYGSPSWNVNSAKIDSAYLVLRDKVTGKIVQIQLEETEPDSSQFTGHFNVSLGNEKQLTPEVFVPPDDLRGGEKDYKKLYQAIQDNKLVRKPLILKKNDKGQSVLDVYDTREQASQALKAYQEQIHLAQELKNKALSKPVPSAATLAAGQLAERKMQLEKMALDAAKREADRVRLEQIERQKAEERERKSREITEAERAAKKKRAEELAAEGSLAYDQGNFPEAEAKYSQAIELDSGNKAYFFKFGVALYRNQKFNDSLVALKMADVDSKLSNELAYYMGLNYYRLGELGAAHAKFTEVTKSEDPVLAPSAQFYRGVILFSEEKYEDAKKSFEKVIDTSNDPRMDEQAEGYLDRIASALTFKKINENRWAITGVVGLTYDSNVLLAADSSQDQGGAQGADARLLTIADLSYRPVFNEHHEVTLATNASLTNSSKSSMATADPWIYNLSAPYTYKGVLGSKGVRLSAKPAYEILYMDPLAKGKKENILSSAVMGFEGAVIMNKSWISTYTLEYRADDSSLESSTGDDDLDASKISIRTLQMILRDKSKKEAFMGNLGYVMNKAKGKNFLFNRYELGGIYVRPGYWGSTWNMGLSTYMLKFPIRSTERNDFNVTVTTGLSKPIREWFTWGIVASYTRNNSDVDQYKYTKYLIMTTATFNTRF